MQAARDQAILVAATELHIRPWEWDVMQMRDVAAVVLTCRQIEKQRAKEAQGTDREPTKGTNVRAWRKRGARGRQ